MKKQFALLVLGLAVVLVPAGQLARAAAGPGPNDPQDSLPAWSSNGVDVAFERTAAGLASRVFDMAAGGKSIHGVQDGLLRGWVPGTEHLLVQVDSEHTVVQGDSLKDRPLAEFLGTDATASPNGQRVAYLRAGTLYVAPIDGSGEHAVAAGVTPPSWDTAGPVWSPDGTHIVIASGSSLLLVQADGSGTRTLFAGQNQSVNPSWSPDGRTIAFERNASDRWEIWLVNDDGTDPHELYGSPGAANFRYPQFSPVSNSLAFISDFQHARGGATQYQFALYVRDPSGTMHKLVDDVHPYSPPRWSPTAALIAVSAGQECRRFGIYITRPEIGSRAHRRSNLCRFEGTGAADTIRGSQFFDIISGDGGNDVIYGLGGNDRIFGGAGNDKIFGGAGSDRIDCGPGIDTVEAAGPHDVIARNCEHVLR